MIRRWSYINTRNSDRLGRDNYFNVFNLRSVVQQETFLTTTYYRQPLYLPLITILPRKSLFRRRHLTQWFYYSQIIYLWARDYLFCRKYLTFILATYVYKNNYLTYNLLLFSQIEKSGAEGLGLFLTTFLTARLLKFLSLDNKKFGFIKSSLSYSWVLYLSLDSSSVGSQLRTQSPLFKYFNYINSPLTCTVSQMESKDPTTFHERINLILTNIVLHLLRSYYQLNVLLVFTCIN